MLSPLVPRGESIRKNFHKITPNLFVKLFKSLATGRAAGGIFNLAASGGKVSHRESWLTCLFIFCLIHSCSAHQLA